MATVQSDNRLVMFTPARSVVYVQEAMADQASSLSEAEDRVIQAVRAQLRVPRRETPQLPVMVRGQRSYTIGLGMPIEFTMPPAASWQPKSIRILSVARNGTNWEMVVECQWKERVIMDDSFRHISHQKLP